LNQKVVSANAHLCSPDMASDTASNQPCATFSEAGDHFSGEDNFGRFPVNTQYHVSTNVWQARVSQNGKVEVPQGHALAIFLRFQPDFFGKIK
jgi:hypothetical protein